MNITYKTAYIFYSVNIILNVYYYNNTIIVLMYKINN